MDSKAFDLGEEIDKRKVEYVFHKSLWDSFSYPTLDLKITKWKKVKYLNPKGDNLNSGVNLIPNNSGGLYLFYIKCEIIQGLTEYPLYIGRAQYTSSQNLRKRVKEYFQKYSAGKERPKIHKMLKYWGEDLYLAYYPIRTNPSIRNLEKRIINSLLLPMNDSIPDKKISAAVKAFR